MNSKHLSFRWEKNTYIFLTQCTFKPNLYRYIYQLRNYYTVSICSTLNFEHHYIICIILSSCIIFSWQFMTSTFFQFFININPLTVRRQPTMSQPFYQVCWQFYVYKVFCSIFHKFSSSPCQCVQSRFPIL